MLKRTNKIIRVADLFCGAGGTSTGMVEALRNLGFKVELTGINHWDMAIATHNLNHLDSRTFCTGVDKINPRELFKDGELDILWASPECMHHSIARGGKPINDQSRSTAWEVLRWVEACRPSVVLVENVKEFPTWGPVNREGRPIKSMKGKTFTAWDQCFQSQAYRTGHTVLNAADFGDPTTRERFFFQAILHPRRVVFPFPTHSQHPLEDLLQTTRKPWVPARDIIDWSIEGGSIFKRKRQLKPKTLRRIFYGLRKFGLRPYLTPGFGEREGQKPRTHSVDVPAPTVTTSGHHHLVEPYLVHLRGTGTARDIERPVPTITCSGKHHALCEPFLVTINHGDDKAGTNDNRRLHEIDKPLGTVTTKNGLGVVTPFILQQQSGGSPRSADDPLPTIATAGAQALIQPFIIPIDHNTSPGGARAVEFPLSTITTEARHALVEPFVMKYNRTGKGKSVLEPLDTVTTKDRFALVQPEIIIEGQRYLLDIRFRMLQPHELKKAQGFPSNYQFKGTKADQVKQIGNAVPRRLARALVIAAVTQNPDVSQYAFDIPEIEAA